NVWFQEALEEGSEVLFFISSKSGMQVKRPSFGAEGYVLNHLDKPSVDNYLRSTGDRLFEAFDKTTVPYSIFCDSLEVYNQDWTNGFLEEFQKRRGYDLKPYLPSLAIDVGPKTADIRYDWGRTITELFNERFMLPMQKWSKRNGTRFRIQGYGIPPASISSNKWADISDGEGAQWKVVRAARWASSANHIYGRNVTSSETWTWLHSPSFRATPLDMKAEADVHFLQGINQLIGHGWAYTPPYVEYPGWRFYAAGEYSERNPWWIVMPDLARYLQRMSYLMRQGKPQNDVALYLPNADAYSHFTAGRVHLIDAERELVGEKIIPEIFEAGYNLDFFDDTILAESKISSGVLGLRESEHRVVVLPGIERMPLESVRKLDAYVKSGGIVVATRRLPSAVPGMQATDKDQAELKDTIARVFNGSNPTAKFVANDEDLGPVLNSLLQPDAAIAPSGKDFGVVHRRTADADIYFVANTSNQTRKVQIAFRSSGMAEIWDAITGRNAGANLVNANGSRTDISLTFEPYRSYVVVFANQGSLPIAGTRSETGAAIDLNSGWTIAFGSRPPVQLTKLGSWADNEATRYYSGTAAYERSIEIADSFLRSGKVIELDLGEPVELPVQQLRNGMRTWIDPPVREAAVIYVNGQRAGSLWCPPYRLDVTSLIRPGKNSLRIVVGNTALNHMAGRKLPDYKLLNLRYGERFQPQDMDQVQALPSGLTGSLRLVSFK
ncbi:MAG TPA: glycosyl hydrolase, partial [Pyrinomonadaceae bacterium]|nr:glycosyl hydrolase [Pyrinomonadaceae bacterium]